MLKPRGSYNVSAAAQTMKEKSALKSGEYLCCVAPLGRERLEFVVTKQTLASVVFDEVTRSLELEVEQDYFGLRAHMEKQEPVRWIDLTKPVVEQTKGKTFTLDFCVQYYPLHPDRLVDDYSRYLVFLQVLEDLHTARMRCAEDVTVKLLAYTVQSYLGNYDASVHRPGYIMEIDTLPVLTEEQKNAIFLRHVELVDMTSGEAESAFLRLAAEQSMYGLDIYCVKHDVSKSAVLLGVGATGVSLFSTDAGTYTAAELYRWASIASAQFDGTRFMLHIMNTSDSSKTQQINFTCASRRSSKTLWKSVVRHHTFFRRIKSRVKRAGTLSRIVLNTRSPVERAGFCGLTESETVLTAEKSVRSNTRSFNRSTVRSDISPMRAAASGAPPSRVRSHAFSSQLHEESHTDGELWEDRSDTFVRLESFQGDSVLTETKFLHDSSMPQLGGGARSPLGAGVLGEGAAAASGAGAMSTSTPLLGPSSRTPVSTPTTAKRSSVVVPRLSIPPPPPVRSSISNSTDELDALPPPPLPTDTLVELDVLGSGAGHSSGGSHVLAETRLDGKHSNSSHSYGGLPESQVDFKLANGTSSLAALRDSSSRSREQHSAPVVSAENVAVLLDDDVVSVAHPKGAPPRPPVPPVAPVPPKAPVPPVVPVAPKVPVVVGSSAGKDGSFHTPTLNGHHHHTRSRELQLKEEASNLAETTLDSSPSTGGIAFFSPGRDDDDDDEEAGSRSVGQGAKHSAGGVANVSAARLDASILELQPVEVEMESVEAQESFVTFTETRVPEIKESHALRAMTFGGSQKSLDIAPLAGVEDVISEVPQYQYHSANLSIASSRPVLMEGSANAGAGAGANATDGHTDSSGVASIADHPLEGKEGAGNSGNGVTMHHDFGEVFLPPTPFYARALVSQTGVAGMLGFSTHDILRIDDTTGAESWPAENLTTGASGLIVSEKRFLASVQGSVKDPLLQPIPMRAYQPLRKQEANDSLVRPVIILGPSKDQVIDRLVLDYPEVFHTCVPHTTRPARPEESDGLDYHFVSLAEFEASMSKGEFAETLRFQNHLYGTSFTSIRAASKQGAYCVLDVSDPHTIVSLEEAEMYPISIFLHPVSVDNIQAQNPHLSRDAAEMVFSKSLELEQLFRGRYSAIINNDVFDTAYAQAHSAILAETHKPVWVPAYASDAGMQGAGVDASNGKVGKVASPTKANGTPRASVAFEDAAVVGRSSSGVLLSTSSSSSLPLTGGNAANSGNFSANPNPNGTGNGNGLAHDTDSPSNSPARRSGDFSGFSRRRSSTRKSFLGTETIRLEKGSKGLGFSFAGGEDTPSSPGDPSVYVTKIAPGGVAEQDGRLQVGDRLVEVNERSMVKVTHAQAGEILRDCGQSVKLVITRKCRKVKLVAENGVFGLGIKGGADAGTPVVISRVADDSPASRHPRLQLGYEITHVNSVAVRDLTHAQVLDMIRGCKDELDLVVHPRRSCNVQELLANTPSKATESLLSPPPSAAVTGETAGNPFFSGSPITSATSMANPNIAVNFLASKASDSAAAADRANGSKRAAASHAAGKGRVVDSEDDDDGEDEEEEEEEGGSTDEESESSAPMAPITSLLSRTTAASMATATAEANARAAANNSGNRNNNDHEQNPFFSNTPAHASSSSAPASAPAPAPAPAARPAAKPAPPARTTAAPVPAPRSSTTTTTAAAAPVAPASPGGSDGDNRRLRGGNFNTISVWRKGYTRETGSRVAQLPANVPRNRYKDILPYDDRRVRLQSGTNDYVNASPVRIDGPGFSLRYIASQGPKDNTADHFWQMVHENGVSVICMLTTLNEGGRPKCFQYWPDAVGSEHAFGEYNVRFISEDKYGSSHVLRTLELEAPDAPSRQILHLQFVAWPDHGVPEEGADFLRYLEEVQRLKRRAADPSAPMVVHCSAGIGRTGVYIALEASFALFERNSPVDLVEVVRSMREQRVGMVQTEVQFQFIYKILAQARRTDGPGFTIATSRD